MLMRRSYGDFQLINHTRPNKAIIINPKTDEVVWKFRNFDKKYLRAEMRTDGRTRDLWDILHIISC